MQPSTQRLAIADKIIRTIRHGLLVSCQAEKNSPMHGPAHMVAMARAAALGGAVGFRIEGTQDVSAVSASTGLLTIGMIKRHPHDEPVFITPSYSEAQAVVAAGADIVATDGTARPRPAGETFASLVARIHDQLSVPVLADVDSLESGLFAVDQGADLIATTLSGYTKGEIQPVEPDLELVSELAEATNVPVIAEGRYWTTQQITEAFRRGAHAIVIGTAITDPTAITRRYIDCIATLA